MNESELAHARQAVVEAARSLLDGRADFFEAVRAIAGHAYTLDPDMKDDELLGFMGIDSQTDHLAVGRVLEEWHPSVREQKRAEVIAFEQSFRPDALRDAATLIGRYGRAT
jgi:hypothetical protein